MQAHFIAIMLHVNQCLNKYDLKYMYLTKQNECVYVCVKFWNDFKTSYLSKLL